MTPLFNGYGTGGVAVVYNVPNGAATTITLDTPNERELTYQPETISEEGADGRIHHKRLGIRPRLTLVYIITDDTKLEAAFQAFNISDYCTVTPYADQPLVSFVMRLTDRSKIEPFKNNRTSQLKVTLDFECKYRIAKAPDADSLIVCRRGGVDTVPVYGKIFAHPYSRRSYTGTPPSHTPSNLVVSIN